MTEAPNNQIHLYVVLICDERAYHINFQFHSSSITKNKNIKSTVNFCEVYQ